MIDRPQLRRADEQRTGDAATDPAILAAGFSVALSWYLYFVRGDRHGGLFVGAWPPTILAFASYFNQTRMADDLNSLVRGRSANVIETLEGVVGSR